MKQRTKPIDVSTLVGFTAILLWSLLAVLTKWTGAIPVFEVAAIAFSISFVISFFFVSFKADNFRLIFGKISFSYLLLSWFGLFGYHFFYFMALKRAPAVEASLISYVWPILLVIFSTLWMGYRLNAWIIAGALVSFSGLVSLVARQMDASSFSNHLLGFAFAFCAGLTWATYSVLNRKYTEVPTESISWVCGLTALSAWICHFYFEDFVVPVSSEYLALLVLGIGPVGLAFFAWDYGTKKGNLPLLGILSYLTPVLSTFFLFVFGGEAVTSEKILGCALITLGAGVASWPQIRASLPS